MSKTQAKNKVALVTGGARRIGAAIVKRLHQDGYDIALTFNHSRQAASELAHQLNALRENSVSTFQCELDSIPSIKQMANAVTSFFSRCDLLVNNASSFFPTPLEHSDEAAWDNLFNSNAKGPLFVAQALQAELKKRRGAIINIADVYAERPLRGHTIYCMAKAANVMLTKSLALELAPEIRVNGLAPGAALWPEDKNGNPVENPAALKAIPLGTLGSASAIADAVAFLAKKDNYITGQILQVDGGRSLNI